MPSPMKRWRGKCGGAARALSTLAEAAALLAAPQATIANVNPGNQAANNLRANQDIKAITPPAVDKSNIPKGDRNKLIKKIREIKENPYIENLNTTAIVEVKQIIFH